MNNKTKGWLLVTIPFLAFLTLAFIVVGPVLLIVLAAVAVSIGIVACIAYGASLIDEG